LRTRAIPERIRGVFTTRRYTNPRLPLPFLNWCTDLPVPWTVKKLRRLSDVVFGFYTSDPDCDFQELWNEADHRLFNIRVSISCTGTTVATRSPTEL